ncbi:MAG: single-stranded-DNA-specific exonuclease RecJ [Bdellovibrionales bacterium]
MKIWESKLENSEVSQGPAFLSWPRPLRDFIQSRGFSDDQDFERFLKSDLQSLKNPFSIKGMSEACSRLEKAYLDKEKICIYADFDLDGTSGCALLKKAFDQLGYQDVMAYQPKRLKQGYGFHAPIVDELKSQGVSLIVTCDVGITANKACSRARELGVDVILTDHHLPSQELPEAFIIVNPNQPEDSSGLGYLSGAGVAFYLVRALKRRFTDLGWESAQALNLKDILDCFTIATITDMVPLIEDNRVLTQVGLKVLSQTQRPGLQVLLQQLGLQGKVLSSSDVAIRFAPKLNALSRLEGEVLPLDIYLEESFQKAYSVIEFVMAQNAARGELQSQALKVAEEIILEQKHSNFHFVHSEQFHRGVLGLIATSLVEQTQKPCFVASLDPEEGKLVGSCRVPDSMEISLVEALESASQGLLRFGGHAQAAGFELHVSEIENVKSALHNYFSLLRPKISKCFFDSVVQFEELNWELVNSMNQLEPFGVGFESPVFLVRNLQVISIKLLKSRHLKVQFKCSHSGIVKTGLLFSPNPRQSELIRSKVPLDLIVQVQVNEWKGQKDIQLLVDDVRQAEPLVTAAQSESELR